MTTTRTRLQELGLDDLRAMATQVEIEADGLQKSKLIAAILEAEKFDDSMLPEATADAPAQAKTRSDQAKTRPDQDQRNDGDGGDGGEGGNRRRNRGRTRGQREPIDESTLETRAGILDILPEGYGFLRTEIGRAHV